MAAYCHVHGFGHLQADSRGLGSALEPYEYETIFSHNFNHLAYRTTGLYKTRFP